MKKFTKSTIALAVLLVSSVAVETVNAGPPRNPVERRLRPGTSFHEQNVQRSSSGAGASVSSGLARSSGWRIVNNRAVAGNQRLIRPGQTITGSTTSPQQMSPVIRSSARPTPVTALKPAESGAPVAE